MISSQFVYSVIFCVSFISTIYLWTFMLFYHDYLSVTLCKWGRGGSGGSVYVLTVKDYDYILFNINVCCYLLCLRVYFSVVGEWKRKLKIL